MPSALCRAVMPYTTGLPRDVAVNDFAVTVPNDLDAAALAFAIASYYNVQATDATYSIGSRLSSLLTRTTNGCRVEVYQVDLTSGDIGSPIGVYPWTMPTATTSSQLPPEVALCSSVAATTDPGDKPARRRGRIYLGPLTAVVVSDLGIHPDTVFVNNIRLAEIQLIEDLGALDCERAVWSRTDHAFFPVVRGWIDNAWDTQRRRGLEATSRTSWVPVP